MRKINWNDSKVSAQREYQSVKAIQELTIYLKNIPEEGYVRDNRTGEILKIDDCRKTTINRLIKFMIKLYHTAKTPETRAQILNKQKELESALNTK